LKAVAQILDGPLASLSALGIDAAIWRTCVSHGGHAAEYDDRKETVHVSVSSRIDLNVAT